MNATAQENPNPSPPTRQNARDYGNLLVGALFIFLGIGSLVDREWIDGWGWLTLALSQIVLLVSPPITNENWKQPRYLACFLLLIVGISLVLTSPSHHRKVSATPPSNPTAPAANNL